MCGYKRFNVYRLFLMCLKKRGEVSILFLMCAYRRYNVFIFFAMCEYICCNVSVFSLMYGYKCCNFSMFSPMYGYKGFNVSMLFPSYRANVFGDSVTKCLYHFLPPLSPAFPVFLPEQQEPKMCQMSRYHFNLWPFLKGSFWFRLNPTAGSRESLRKSIFPG